MIKVKLSKVDEDSFYKVLRHDAYTVNVISRDPLNEGKLRFKIGSKVYSYTIEEFLTHVVKIYPLAIVPRMYEDIVQRNGGRNITRNTLLSPMVDYSKILPDFYYRKSDKHDKSASGTAYILLPESLTEDFMRKVYDVAKLPLTDESLVSLHNIYNSVVTSISNNASSNGKKVKEQKIYDCKDCINSIYLDELNCKLKMIEENKKAKSSKADKAIDCIWYIKRNK